MAAASTLQKAAYWIHPQIIPWNVPTGHVFISNLISPHDPDSIYGKYDLIWCDWVAAVTI